MKRKLFFLSLLALLASASYACRSHSNCNCPGLGHAQKSARPISLHI